MLSTFGSGCAYTDTDNRIRHLAATVAHYSPGARTLDLHQFSDWLASTPLSQSIQISTWAIPGIQSVHIICLALLFASALVFALRIAGLGLANEPLPQLALRFTRAIWTLLVVLLATGALLITAEPGRTITNPMFYAKMIMLAAVVIITLWLAAVARRELERPSGLHVALAGLSMLLWIGIIFAGRLIAYIESY
jgi:cytochrome bd-type quinol oxidase subunit 2